LLIVPAITRSDDHFTTKQACKLVEDTWPKLYAIREISFCQLAVVKLLFVASITVPLKAIHALFSRDAIANSITEKLVG